MFARRFVPSSVRRLDMPSHAPRDYPIRKKLNLQKQEHRLVHAIKNKLNTTQTEKAAELVRKAQLGYAKARHDLELHKHPNDIRHDQLKKGRSGVGSLGIDASFRDHRALSARV